MRSRRPGTALFLVGGALLLLVAIAIGQRLGDSVLGQITEQRDTGGFAIMTPVPQASEDLGQARNWKREQVVSVATDPAFPDPRATPEPTPKPVPTANPTTPPPTLPPLQQALPASKPTYTSPPLPIPIASHPPDEVETEPPDVNPNAEDLAPLSSPAPSQTRLP